VIITVGDKMPSPRTVLADINDLGLDPRVAHTQTSKSGRLKVQTEEAVVEPLVEFIEPVTEPEELEEVEQVEEPEEIIEFELEFELEELPEAEPTADVHVKQEKAVSPPRVKEKKKGRGRKSSS
jgi:hypothetical protein